MKKETERIGKQIEAYEMYMKDFKGPEAGTYRAYLENTKRQVIEINKNFSELDRPAKGSGKGSAKGTDTGVDLFGSAAAREQEEDKIDPQKITCK